MNLHNCECSHTSLQLEIPRKLMYIFMIENVTSRLSGRLLPKGIISKFNTHTAKTAPAWKMDHAQLPFSYTTVTACPPHTCYWPYCHAREALQQWLILEICLTWYFHRAFHLCLGWRYMTNLLQCSANQPRVRDVSKHPVGCSSQSPPSNKPIYPSSSIVWSSHKIHTFLFSASPEIRKMVW